MKPHRASRPVGRFFRVGLEGPKNAAMFVASIGRNTADAVQFAAQVGMTLVDGKELLRIIGHRPAREALKLPTPTAGSTPSSPACGAAMVWRTARRG